MLKFLLEKEFKQIFRNAFIPKLILVMPVMMMLVLPWAANQEIKNVKLSVIDSDRSTFSERLINKIVASGYFILTDVSASYSEAMHSVDAGKADIIFEIPQEFERNLYKSGVTDVMISANAVNGMKGGLGSAYLSSIVNDFVTELRMENGELIMKNNSQFSIRLQSRL
jgi:ABC-2 type transport system permease protein